MAYARRVFNSCGRTARRRAGRGLHALCGRSQRGVKLFNGGVLRRMGVGGAGGRSVRARSEHCVLRILLPIHVAVQLKYVTVD